MKLLLTLLLIPSLLHARPLVIQVANDSELSMNEFSVWANERSAAIERTTAYRSFRRIKVVEKRGYTQPLEPVSSFGGEWLTSSRRDLEQYRINLGNNDIDLVPVLRRSNIYAVNKSLTNGTRFFGGIANLTPYPFGYTNPSVWTSGVAYVGLVNSQGIDRKEISFGVILHEALHTMGAEHSNDPCDVMYPSINVDYPCGSSRGSNYISTFAGNQVAINLARSLRRFRRERVRCVRSGFGNARECKAEMLKAKRRQFLMNGNHEGCRVGV